jgi:hypothetical protein
MPGLRGRASAGPQAGADHPTRRTGREAGRRHRTPGCAVLVCRLPQGPLWRASGRGPGRWAGRCTAYGAGGMAEGQRPRLVYDDPGVAEGRAGGCGCREVNSCALCARRATRWTRCMSNSMGRSARKTTPWTRAARNMAQRFRRHGDAYFRFVTTPGVEPTNNPACERSEQTGREAEARVPQGCNAVGGHNLAEQAPRLVVIDRRTTQGTRGNPGRCWCERIWTVFATCRQTRPVCVRVPTPRPRRTPHWPACAIPACRSSDSPVNGYLNSMVASPLSRRSPGTAAVSSGYSATHRRMLRHCSTMRACLWGESITSDLGKEAPAASTYSNLRYG